MTMLDILKCSVLCIFNFTVLSLKPRGVNAIKIRLLEYRLKYGNSTGGYIKLNKDTHKNIMIYKHLRRKEKNSIIKKTNCKTN